jgi:hydroxyacylglutathione hydrolase
MFDVIRIPAFKDNYIWLLRKGASAAVVDPGDARPVLDVLEREGLSLSQHSRHPSPCRSSGRGGGSAGAHPAEVFGPAAESITGISKPLRGGETVSIAACDSTFR